MMQAEEVGRHATSMAERAQIRASFLSLAASPFNDIPNEAYVRRVLNDGFLRALQDFVTERATAESDGCDDVQKGCALMLAFLQTIEDGDPAVASEALGVDRTRLYRGIAPNYGPVPPYETEWVGESSADVGDVLVHVIAEYGTEGWGVSSEAKDRADYAGVEIAFCCHLAADEERAWRAGRTKRALELLNVQRAFRDQHVGAWVPAFIESALPQAQTDFYRGHLTMLRGLLQEEW